MQPELSPVMSLTLKLREMAETREFNEKNLEIVTNAGFDIRPHDQYPFFKDTVYSDPLPFQVNDPSLKKTNVVLIYLEGFSARWMEVYGGSFSNLTPNLDAFANRSMRVDNYFSHTAATYRGL